MSAPLTIGSLFAGIGGFDLAGETFGWRTSWFVEWDAACCGWLAEHFPDRPIYGDITQTDFTEVERVDILAGGFPCPPVSGAGRRLGKRDPRWLWPHFVRAIRDVRPRYVAIENVPGLLSTRDDELGGQPLAGTVLGDLAQLGYDAEWAVLSAGDVGAPQERKRVWIVAYAQRVERGGIGREVDRSPRLRSHHAENAAHGGGAELGHPASGRRGAGEGLAVRRTAGERESVGDSEPLGSATGPSGSLAGHEGHAGIHHDAGREGDRRLAHGPWDAGVPVRGADGTVRLIPREAAEQGPESPLWPVADGIPGRVARLRAVGNAVVPACVIEGPFRVIAEREAALSLDGAA